MSDRKRKLAGVLSLGALAAGAGSTASASWYNPFSWGIGKKLKNASESVKSLIKGSEVYQADNKLYNEIEIKKGYAAAVNIAERIYNVLENREDKKALINKLKELCIDDATVNAKIDEFNKDLETLKTLSDNTEKGEGSNSNLKSDTTINGAQLGWTVEKLRKNKSSFLKNISSYASFLISIADEIGIEDSTIKGCLKENIGEKYVEANVESNSGIKKIVDGEVRIGPKIKSYSIFLAKVGQTLTLSEKSTDNSLFEYISNTEFNNEQALLNAIKNIKSKIFDLENDNDGSKAKKLIASLIINKYKNNKDEESYNKIIDELLEFKVGNENKEFKYSDYVTSFRNKKIEKAINLTVDSKSDLDYILRYATDNDQANNIFSEKTKNFVKRIADSKITRLAVTGAGAYLGGMVLAPALGLSLLGTTVLATGTASAANVATDFVSDRNARSMEAWSIGGIGARYNSLSTRIPMTLAVYSARAIVGSVGGLAAALFYRGK